MFGCGRLEVFRTVQYSGRTLLLVAFLLLVVRPGAPSSVLVPSSDALVTSSVLLFLVAMPGATSTVLVTN